MSPVKPPKFLRRIGFTDREREILKAVAMYRRVHSAAKVLHLKDATIRSTLFRIRLRYDHAAEFIDEYSKWKKEMPRGKYL